MTVHEFGNQSADIVLVQPVDQHDLETIGNEIKVIADNQSVNCVLEWNEGNHFKDLFGKR